MSDAALPPVLAGPAPVNPWWLRLAASPRFQALAARLPLTRPFVRHEGAAMFDLVAGFCHAQVLQALVTLEVLPALQSAPRSAEDLAARTAVPADRLGILMRAAAALGLVRERRGLWRLTLRGAALAGVPGLPDMIRHHAVLYQDLADPAAFFRGTTRPQLAAFWPYVFGAGAAADPVVAERYSTLMAESQALVAADTLAQARLSDCRALMDVGGGSGAFALAAAQAHPHLALTVLDLPAVVPAAVARFAEAGLAHRLTVQPGSFRDEALPRGADAISLIRVLYDHSDATVRALLAAVRAALPPGGRLLISEPMTGATRPERAGDAYFALYCLAMETGRARSAPQIAAMLVEAGFGQIRCPRPRRAFVTTVIEAVRLD